jgi:hypothetical protein
VKADLITIFPAIVLETKRWDWTKEVEDKDALDDFTFGKTRVVSYKKLHTKPKTADSKYLEHIDLIHPTIIDSDGKTLNDYTIIIDRDVSIQSLDPPTCNFQHLITYFCLLQRLDYWSSVDFIKMLCVHGGGRRLYVNNKDKLFTKLHFFLPLSQDTRQKLIFHKQREKVLIDIVETLYKKNIKSYKRLLNAITLFNESCRINDFNPNSAIVLIVSSFEALLHLPKFSKTENFVYAFKFLWRFDEDIGNWAKELYELRCEIVHGEVVADEKRLASKEHHYPNFDIARSIFHTCLLFVLEIYGYVSLEQGEKNRAMKSFKNKIIPNKQKVQGLLKQREKFTYKSFLERSDLYQDFLTQVESLTFTDYSAERLTGKLLDHIWLIAENWIDDEKKKDFKMFVEKEVMTKADVKKYKQFTNEKFDKILKLIGEIKNVKISPKGRYIIHDKIRNIKKELRQLEPSVYSYSEKFPFTIGVFLTRCLHALF